MTRCLTKTLILLLALILLTACAPAPPAVSTPAPAEQTQTTPHPAIIPAPPLEPPPSATPEYPHYDPPLTNVLDDWGHLPLWAKIPSENIYLYGVQPDGYILYQDGFGTYFNWQGITPRRILPELKYADFDGDGEKEVAVALCVVTGTGFQQMELHVLEKELSLNNWMPRYTDFSLSGEDLIPWFRELATATQPNENGIVTFSFEGFEYQISLTEQERTEGGTVTMSVGDIIEFQFEDDGRIRVIIPVGFVFESWAAVNYFAEMGADVIFNGESFTLKNHSLTVYDAYSPS